MQSVSVAETRRHLAKILGKVAQGGETFVISKKGRPMARLVPMEPVQASDEKPMTLATMPGWLDDDDPFFGHLAAIRKTSRREKPSNPFRSEK